MLGRPSALTRLFDYLLERTLAGETPKEIEIACKVFGKNSGFDVAQDAVVRVYVHKLRRRLEEYYARLEDRSAARLTIPKGEYRLIVEEPSVHAARSAVSIDRPRAARWTFVAVVAVLAGAIGSLLTYVAMRPDQRGDQLAELRASPLWAPLFSDDLPITIVIGDYYLTGETDGPCLPCARSGLRRTYSLSCSPRGKQFDGYRSSSCSCANSACWTTGAPAETGASSAGR